MGGEQVYTPCMVDGLIAQGQTIVIYQDYVLRLDGWMDKHPGGRLAILHMVGRDATDEMNAYHSTETIRTMKCYRIGRKQGQWTSRTPPIRGGTFVADVPESTYGSDTDDDAASVVSSALLGDASSVDDATSVGDTCIDSLDNASPASEDGEGLRFRLGRSDTLRPSPSSLPKTVDAAVQRLVERDEARYPSLDRLVQQDIQQKYRQLHQQVIDEGLYTCRYIEYGKELTRYTALFCMFLLTLHYGWYTTSAVFLGLFWHQIMFSAHDAGHLAITKNFVVDTMIGMFVADFCCGLSIGWWKSSHNVHHLITNHPEHDPDIQNLPFFATCPSFFKSLRSTYYDGFAMVWDRAAEILVPIQKYMYYPIMAIARFNLYVLSWCHVLSPRSSLLSASKAWWVRPAEVACMACYWFLYGYCLVWRNIPDWWSRVVFVLVSHVVPMPLHIQINLSHWGMSTVELGAGESFAQRQLRTTMDVSCPAWLDFIHGGLQFQAVHHLFPRVPRHNLRRVRALAQDFCAETGIPYAILSFIDSNKWVLGHLGDVSKQVQMLMDCQKDMVQSADGEPGAVLPEKYCKAQ